MKWGWLEPKEYQLPGQRPVKLLVDFGTGEHEIDGVAVKVEDGVVFHDDGHVWARCMGHEIGAVRRQHNLGPAIRR